MKKLLAGILVLCMLLTFAGCGGGEKVLWDDIELSQYIPKPEKFDGNVTTNRSDLTIFEVVGITKNEYKDYVQQCIDMGYNIDLEYENWDTVYGAFNNAGYSVRIIYNDTSEEINVTVKIPETQTMKEIEWPSSGLATVVPVPTSTFGDISWNNSTTFIVHLGNTSIEAYNDYVKECEKYGFSVDFSKSDKSYSALNNDGYKLHLMYLGANVIEISIEAPKNDFSTPSKDETSSDITSSDTEDDDGSIGKDFKAAMDGYEDFMDDYVAFMKKYQKNPGDLSLLADYTDFLTKYTQWVEDFEKWEDEDLNTAELAYYTDVQARVTKKLLEVAQ